MARIRNQKALRREFWRTAGYKLPHRKTVKFGDERHYPTDTRVAFVDFVDSMQRGGEIDESLADRATLGSFGAGPRAHGHSYVGLLQDVEGHLDSAERVLRGGDCSAGVDSVLAAERLYGEARGNMVYAPKAVKLRHSRRFANATTRLNFLRQALKRCVG